LLSLPRYRQRIAEALFSAIVEYASNVASHDVDVEKGTDDDHGT
jgi:hypothetical protein